MAIIASTPHIDLSIIDPNYKNKQQCRHSKYFSNWLREIVKSLFCILDPLDCSTILIPILIRSNSLAVLHGRLFGEMKRNWFDSTLSSKCIRNFDTMSWLGKDCHLVGHLNWRTTIRPFDGLAFELAFQGSGIKSLTLKMTLKNRGPAVWGLRKAYRPKK